MAAWKWNRSARSCPADRGALVVLVVTAISFAASLSGCSLIGLGVGSAIDAGHSRRPELLTPEGAAFLPQGTPVTLVTIDSTMIHGFVIAPSSRRGKDSRQLGVRIAHLRSENSASIDTLLVPLDQIAYARAAPQHHGARTGFHAGLMADLTVLGIAAAAVLLILLILLMASSSGFSLG